MVLATNKKVCLPGPPKKGANMSKNHQQYLVTSAGQYVVGVVKLIHLE
jgi:hypothetical protein